MEIGDRFAYRARGYDPLVEVELLKVGVQKPARVQVRFVDENAEGRIEWVPPARLKCPWSEADSFLEREHRWERLSAMGPGDESPAYWAASQVIDTVIPREVAEMAYKTNGALCISDVPRLLALLSWKESALLADPASFEEGGEWLVPWPTVLRISTHLAAAHPEEVLAEVDRAQHKADTEATYGHTYRGRRGEDDWHIPAQRCVEMDEEAPYGRRCRDLLREWCGSDAVERRDELVALRQEVRRLGRIAEQALEALEGAGRKREASKLRTELGVPADVFRGRP